MEFVSLSARAVVGARCFTFNYVFVCETKCIQVLMANFSPLERLK